jgi:hypothetical protein
LLIALRSELRIGTGPTGEIEFQEFIYQAQYECLVPFYPRTYTTNKGFHVDRPARQHNPLCRMFQVRGYSARISQHVQGGWRDTIQLAYMRRKLCPASTKASTKSYYPAKRRHVGDSISGKWRLMMLTDSQEEKQFRMDACMHYLSFASNMAIRKQSTTHERFGMMRSTPTYFSALQAMYADEVSLSH